MKLFLNKKAFVAHPGTWIFVAFILGMVAAYIWINYTTISNPFCPVR